MRVISRKTLIDFWTRHRAAKSSLSKWYAVTKSSRWRRFTDIRQTYPLADKVQVKSGCKVVVFNVGGNNIRVITAVHYNTNVLYVLMVLSHKEYDKQKWKDIL